MKKRRPLYYNLIETYIVYFILAFVTVATLTSFMLKRYMIDRKADILYKSATQIAKTYANQMYSGNLTSQQAAYHLKIVDSYIDCPIWIVDTSGRIMLNTRDDKAYEKNERVEDFDTTLIHGVYMTGDFYGYFNESMVSVFAPINSDFKIRGYVVIHLSIKEMMMEHENLLRISYITMIMLFILSLIVLLVFTVIVYRPLGKITQATEEYAKGNYNVDLDIESSAEMGYLASTLKYMASEIENSEENQKKFIANVSHDFRSPLTSIKGYLTAMLDGTIPDELHSKYIGIVLNETERLTGLTNSLLQLNNLNTKGMKLDIKEFDINKIIRNCCETFEGRCLERRIAIELLLTEDIMHVKGDEGRIQQVIYNLLDNAIKFSNDDSEIRIETTVKKDKLFVSVKDYGIGIPKESVGKVFDRFYKSDSSRGKDKKGTGLGLSIVKEIIKAHNENIDVISTEGVGTEFVFTLTCVE